MNQGLGINGQLAETDPQEFLRDFFQGLSTFPKTIPCKYLYDEQGARLFEAICDLEEYYPTRTEMQILQQNMPEIASLLGPRCNLVELGSGNSMKTRLLLDASEHPAAYIPIDVARNQLLESCAEISSDYPGLEVFPLCADFSKEFQLPFQYDGATVFFPGSTIGNFEPEEAVSFLRRMAALCGPEGGILLGVDLKKDPDILRRAYNDAQGVTAAFNLNLLGRANRELEAGFDLNTFWHEALYHEAAGRIEMHLVSQRAQHVGVGDRKFSFARGESICTEHSYKYHLEEFRLLAARAGLEAARCWTDKQEWFSVQYLVPEKS